jgi:hypothetical protein
MNMFFLLFSFLTVCFADPTQNKQYSCMEQYQPNGQPYNPKRQKCCGIKANGKYECHKEPWQESEGKYRYCTNSLSDILNGTSDRDLCCEKVGDCGTCKAFTVLKWTTQEDIDKAYEARKTANGGTDNGEGITLSTKWRDVYENTQGAVEDVWNPDPSSKAAVGTNPVGFISATLREFSDPPVCVYVPKSAGRMVEILVEPEENGNRLCVSDLKSDLLSRNEPGQGTPCDETRLRTCFADAATTTNISNQANKDDFAFYIFCNEGCAEGGDVPLWLRARASKSSWIEGHKLASQNVEMWCQTVLDNYPDWNQYPSDLEEYKGAPSTAITQSSSYSFSILSIFVLALGFL